MYSEEILPHLLYEGEHLSYQVGYDPRDKIASTLVLKERPEGGDRYHVSIVTLVRRAGLGQPGDVQTRATTGEMLIAALESLAMWVRRLHSTVDSPDGDALLRSPNWPPR